MKRGEKDVPSGIRGRLLLYFGEVKYAVAVACGSDG